MKVKFKDLTMEQIKNICLKQEKKIAHLQSQCDDCPIARQCDENFAHSPVYFGAFEEEIDLPDEKEPAPRKEYSYPGCMCC